MTDGILHLVNSYQWYDMIERGEKLEEYRDISTWEKVISKCHMMIYANGITVPTDVKQICFHRGYTNTTMLRDVEEIYVGIGRPEWGAPNYPVFIIRLKKVRRKRK
jgi:hypothetical protein